MTHDRVRELRHFDHPGEGRRRARPVPKGRQVDPDAAEEIALLLGDRSRRRDLLIEYLHLIQDGYGQISAAHLAALADELRISLAEAFEVATFYSHFDVVKDEDRAVPRRTIRVCDSIACQMAGAEELIAALGAEVLPETRILRAPCIGQCACAPAAVVGQQVLAPASLDGLRDAVSHEAQEICEA